MEGDRLRFRESLCPARFLAVGFHFGLLFGHVGGNLLCQGGFLPACPAFGIAGQRVPGQGVHYFS